ncbi:MAG TPA: hypothetical protein PK691_13180, partial [Thermomicrobiales bacterium]|nr:hypothetical protein [Thermomicrobiales bacterium]
MKLHGGDVLWFGPVSRDQRALVRLAADRIAIAVESVLQRTVDERPRGAARATALNALLTGPEDLAARTGPMLGLANETRYRVALVPNSADGARLQQAIGHSGGTFEAGEIGTEIAMVLHMRSEASDSRRGGNRPSERAVEPILLEIGAEWAAVS